MASEIVTMIDVSRLQMREVIAGRWRCCWNCDNWRENAQADTQGDVGRNPTCDKFKQRPPTEVIIVGCPEWFASGIPF